MFDHEGGIATPLIACWPAVIEAGAVSHEVGHVVDFLPTFAELAGAEYPERYRGNRIAPADGISLAPLLRGQPRSPHPYLCWELNGCRAIRRGRWKAVSTGPPRCFAGHRFPPGRDGWELYDMAADRCETNDLAAERPALVRELDSLWRGWYERCRREQRRAQAQSFDPAQ